MKKNRQYSALRYILLKKAQSILWVDPRMSPQEEEFKDQAQGLYEEFVRFKEHEKNSNILLAMKNFVDRKMASIPLG